MEEGEVVEKETIVVVARELGKIFEVSEMRSMINNSGRGGDHICMLVGKVQLLVDMLHFSVVIC